MMETEVYGQLVTRKFWIQQKIISCYEIFYIFLSGVIGTIINKMIAAPLLPASNLNDPLSASTATQQQSTGSNTINKSAPRIVSNNPETDHISSPRNNSLQFIIIKHVNSHQKTFFNAICNNRGISKDVIDNKTDNFVTPPFCNIQKRMSEIYCNENERLKTFQDWPLDFIDKEILAKTGFFFTGDDDKVKCYFCEVEIGRWESNDNPISEHTRWSPNCPLIRRRSTNNIAIDAESLNRLLPPISYDVCGANDIIEVRPNAYAEGSISSLSPIGSPMNSLPNTPNSVTATTQTNFLYPDHPEYAIESARLRSFAEWPRNMKQKPEQLSEAGFFYTGIGDRVKCFSCGGGLKDWDENDDPWEQHALWLGNCHYLKLMKGAEYVQAVAEKFKTAEASDEDEEEQHESKELGKNENEQQISNHCSSTSSSSNSSNTCNSNNNNCSYDEVPNIASTSSTASPAKLIVKAIAISAKTTGQSNNNNKSNNNSNHHNNSNVNCNNCNSATSTSSSSSSSSESGSVSSVNSNSSKEAETVCKQPKLDCHHHHISRDLHHDKKPITISEEKLCKICYAAEYNTAFLPCGHVVACAKCASSVTKCPMCRKPFTDVMRVYFS